MMTFGLTQVVEALRALDARLMAIRGSRRAMVLVLTGVALVVIRLWMVPAEVLDTGFNRTELIGMDYWADSYVGRVVANHPRDMYLKVETPQLGRETRWTKPAAAPYPPFALLFFGGMHLAGVATGLGFYGMLVLVEAAFLTLALVYCLRTRWYLFPLTYLNAFLALRVYWVGGASNILVLLLMMVALLLARVRSPWAQVVMALSIVTKVTPAFYLVQLRRWAGWTRALVVLVLATGLVLPLFWVEGYAGIWQRHAGRDTAVIGETLSAYGWGALTPVAVALAYVLPLVFVGWFTSVLLRVQKALDWDDEDRIGWAAAPFALLFSLRVAALRMFFMAMLLPDKRGTRGVFVAVMGLADLVMLGAGFGFNDAVRNIIWDILGVALLVAIAQIWLREARLRDPESARLSWRPARLVRLLP